MLFVFVFVCICDCVFVFGLFLLFWYVFALLSIFFEGGSFRMGMLFMYLVSVSAFGFDFVLVWSSFRFLAVNVSIVSALCFRVRVCYFCYCVLVSELFVLGA